MPETTLQISIYEVQYHPDQDRFFCRCLMEITGRDTISGWYGFSFIDEMLRRSAEQTGLSLSEAADRLNRDIQAYGGESHPLGDGKGE